VTATSRSLSRLRLTQFRNYHTGALDLDQRHLVLIGPNGAGKTNLLEAISLFSPGRGLRGAAFEELAAQGSDGAWAVATTIETPDGPVDIGTGSAPDGGRRVRINGAPARAIEDMSAFLRLLWLTPAMDGLFTGPASDRRRFLDRLVTTLVPGHAATVNDYEKAMRQRNKVLDEGGDAYWLSALEAQMAGFGAALHCARADSLADLDHLAAQAGEGDFPVATLGLTPMIEQALPATSADLEALLRDIWAAERPRDRAAGRTLTGPHRVDLTVVHRQKAMPAALGSTGEQKALLIGLILAHARLVRRSAGIAPILLLDEIAAHLDPNRRAALFSALDALGSQCVMTGTDLMLFDALGARAQRVLVEDGQLVRQPG
jgi:DNA replication and repair protein RecF